MKFFFDKFFKLRTELKFLDIGISSKNNWYEFFCLFGNFSKSEINPSDKSIEYVANLLRRSVKEYLISGL